MSTGTPTTFKFMTLEHPLAEPDCWMCWDLEAALCEEPRCEGRIHNEAVNWYTNEMGDPVWVVMTACDGQCGKQSQYEWVDEEAEDEEEDDEEYEYE